MSERVYVRASGERGEADETRRKWWNERVQYQTSRNPVNKCRRVRVARWSYSIKPKRLYP